jgi:hypothetical protein
MCRITYEAQHSPLWVTQENLPRVCQAAKKQRDGFWPSR